MDPPIALAAHVRGPATALRSARKARAPRVDAPYDDVVLPAELVGEAGWLVYELAATTNAEEMLVGGHTRIKVSADGTTVEEVFPFARSAVEFPAATCHACPLRAKCTDAGPGRVARSRSRPTSRSSTSSASGRPPQRVGNNFASGSPSNTAKHTPATARVGARATAVPARISSIFGASVPSPTSRSSLASSTLEPLRRRFAKPRDHGGFKTGRCRLDAVA